ncbi:hypothetical protein A3860_22220 [Niastella vici]|uniref:DUF4843 domain-containing protein n=1 Tax=Niastella vici TaxID=1703345 RepID=A0A1V9G0M4_9BACT|nr:DUF4843 domain-containing protein [Niastella vici]OQP64124.1 hypothetical protein A3860_22220 [Niastella vici]
MKKRMIILMAVVVAMTACRKADQITYHSADNIYFDLDPWGLRDSILYTFAYHPNRLKDTVWVPVSISGNRVNKDRYYAVKVVDTATTALPNIHYEPLKDQYKISAGYGWQNMPVVLYNTDTQMVRRSFSLTIQMVSTDDFGAGFPSLITARLVFSGKLEKPKWWDMWLGGYYSQVKHQLFRLAATTDDLSTSGLDAPENLYFVDKLKSLLNAPFTWVTNNPDKGYLLTARPDGNYDFYYSGTPNKKILLQKDGATGKYYFIDENGKQVI